MHYLHDDVAGKLISVRGKCSESHVNRKSDPRGVRNSFGANYRAAARTSVKILRVSVQTVSGRRRRNVDISLRVTGVVAYFIPVSSKSGARLFIHSRIGIAYVNVGLRL